MRVRTSYDVLKQALSHVNSLFHNNIVMELEDRGLYFLVRLKVRDSKGAGARRSPNGRRLNSACWHTYGEFIEKIFELDDGAVVYTAGKRYNKENWEWIDWNAGSLMNPVYISELCLCGRET